MIPEAIWLLTVHRHTRRWATFAAVAVVGIVGIALLPLAISQNSTGNASWIAPIPLIPRLGQIVPQFLIGFQAPDAMVLERIAELRVAIALVLLVLRSDPACSDAARSGSGCSRSPALP